MNTVDEIRVAKRALNRGLLTLFQLKTAMTELARDRVRNVSGARSLRDILVAAGCIRNEQWAEMMKDSQEREESQLFSTRSFGKYVIQRELGRGGMGVVYEALDTKLSRKIALKILNAHIEGFGHEESQRRFLQEARLLAVLPRHASVVSVYEAGLIDGQRYIAMELIEGIVMSMWQRNATLQEQLKVLREVAFAVHHAHVHGIIHRDLKPENILIRRDNTPVVMDFGLATPEQRNLRHSLTPQGIVLGSPGFMSPEQSRGLKCVDRTTDVYSLGVMLFQILTGRMPFEGKTPIEILVKTVESPAPRPSSAMEKGLNPVLLEKLDTICMKALATNQKDRYPTTKAFGDALSQCIMPASSPSVAS